VRADRARGQEEPVADLAVGQAVASEPDIWRCWGVRSHKASRSPGTPATTTPHALSSASARCAQDRAPSRRKVPRACIRTGLASLIRRPPPQPFGVVEAELGPLEGPLVAWAGSESALFEMGFGAVRTGEDAARAGDELLEPRRRRSAELAERPLEDVLALHPPVGTDRGRRDIGQPR